MGWDSVDRYRRLLCTLLHLENKTRQWFPVLRDASFLLAFVTLAGLFGFGLYEQALLLAGVTWLVALFLTVYAHLPLQIRIRPGLRRVCTFVLSLGREPSLQSEQLSVPHTTRSLFLIVELAIVVAAAWRVTGEFRNLDPGVKVHGKEFEYLTSSATQAALNLREDGYISLWQPWLENGEPLITSPFAFVLNPLSTGPTLLLGAPNGFKVSMVLYAIFAATGGWALGYVLGLGALGRVLLGVLIVGKGYMYSGLAGGFFQLSVSQSYMPWIIAGALATVRYPRRRWPPVLTAVMLTLLFWAGNLWYTLPMLISVGLVALVMTVRVRGRWIDWMVWRRFALSAVITVCLSAATLFPMWQQRRHIDHPDEEKAGRGIALDKVIPLYYDPDAFDRIEHIAQERPQAYYHFTVPGWFLLLLFVIVPPFLPPVFSHVGYRHAWRISLLSMLMIVATTLWGAGGFSIFEWLYEHVKLLREWRFVGRALAVGAFWVIILVALRADSILHMIFHPNWLQFPRGNLLIRLVQFGLAGALGWASIRAADEVLDQWGRYGTIEFRGWQDEACLKWLRRQEPDAPLTVWRYDYDTIQPYLENKVRLFNIEVAYHVLPLPSTIGTTDLTRALPEYAVNWDPTVIPFLLENGYQEIQASPNPLANPFHCLFRRPGAFDYAFSTPLWRAEQELRAEYTQPIELLRRTNDRITVRTAADPDETLVVVVQELAYPGWHVKIDNRPVSIESVGGMIGVKLPPGHGNHEIIFEFRPRLFVMSAWLSLTTALACILYLLKGERIVAYVLSRRHRTDRTGRRIPILVPAMAGNLPIAGGENGSDESSPLFENQDRRVATIVIRAHLPCSWRASVRHDPKAHETLSENSEAQTIIVEFRPRLLAVMLWLSLLAALIGIVSLFWNGRVASLMQRGWCSCSKDTDGRR